jgi:hypothetical protein
MDAPPSLLVLDNLETSWESVSSRKEVEEFLSLLTDVPQLGLMVCNILFRKVHDSTRS